MHISCKLVQPLSDEDMRNPDVKKRLKAFDDKIAAKLANNETLADAEYPTEGWHIEDIADLDNPYLPYDPEANIKDVDDYTEEDLEKTSHHKFYFSPESWSSQGP